ncbi:MAG TPA: hypothetical protein VJU18_05435 [Vicinamibacteria bacterium]|nr:hypothetical protein [Vicinamibacteria bacterium]
MRPHLLGWCLFALLMLLLERRRYWAVPLLLAVWANVHASVLLGAGLSGLRFLEELRATRARRFLVLGAAVAGAPLLNPYGWHAYLLFFRISGHTDFVNEWKPFGTETAGFVVLVLLFLATLAGLLLSRVLSPGDTLRVAVLGYVGFAASRNAVVAAIALGPLLGRWYGPALARLGRSWSVTAACAALAVPLGIGVRHAGDRQLFRFGLNPLHLPVESVAFLERHRLPDPLFNDYNFGGYLLWAAPQRRVFVDGRLEVYGGKPLDDYLKASRGEAGWRQVLDEYGVKTALLRPERPLVRELLRDPGWDLVYFDYNSVVFVRHGEAPDRKRLTNVSPFGNRDRNKPAEALQEIAYVLTENPRFFGGYKIQAFLLARTGDFPGAAAALGRHLELHPAGARAEDVRELASQLAGRGPGGRPGP